MTPLKMTVGESMAKPDGESFQQFQTETTVTAQQLRHQQFARNNLHHHRQPPTHVISLPRQIMMVKKICHQHADIF